VGSRVTLRAPPDRGPAHRVREVWPNASNEIGARHLRVTGADGVSARISRVLSPCGGGSFIWDHRLRRPRAAYPRLERDGPPLVSYLALLRVGFSVRLAVTRSPVRSYRTLSPLPVPRTAIGGLFSVALSVASRRPGVTRHPRPEELGLSSTGRSRRRSSLARSQRVR